LPTTDGEIAVINLESARRRAWSRYFADPLQAGVAETVVEHEQLTLQFIGEVSALVNAMSVMIDYRLFKRLDVYGGVMYSQVNGGLASGFLHDRNVAPTIGMRLQF
jgi:hypothetical protein